MSDYLWDGGANNFPARRQLKETARAEAWAREHTRMAALGNDRGGGRGSSHARRYDGSHPTSSHGSAASSAHGYRSAKGNVGPPVFQGTLIRRQVALANVPNAVFVPSHSDSCLYKMLYTIMRRAIFWMVGLRA